MSLFQSIIDYQVVRIISSFLIQLLNLVIDLNYQLVCYSGSLNSLEYMYFCLLTTRLLQPKGFLCKLLEFIQQEVVDYFAFDMCWWIYLCAEYLYTLDRAEVLVCGSLSRVHLIDNRLLGVTCGQHLFNFLLIDYVPYLCGSICVQFSSLFANLQVMYGFVVQSILISHVFPLLLVVWA